MVTRVRIAKKVLDAIAAETIGSADREVCGLLFGGPDRVNACLPARNVAPDPFRAFEIDPAALLRAHREQRRGGPAIVGCFHSHPGGSSEPSARDAADAEPNGWLWLIVGREPRLWRAVPTGSVRGRFDPVPFTCAAGPDSPESVLSPEPSR